MISCSGVSSGMLINFHGAQPQNHKEKHRKCTHGEQSCPNSARLSLERRTAGMEVAKDEVLMPCRAYFAFLSQYWLLCGKGVTFHQLEGGFVTSPLPKSTVLQERIFSCPTTTCHSHDLSTFPTHKPLSASVTPRQKRVWEELSIFFQN